MEQLDNYMLNEFAADLYEGALNQDLGGDLHVLEDHAIESKQKLKEEIF